MKSFDRDELLFIHGAHLVIRVTKQKGLPKIKAKEKRNANDKDDQQNWPEYAEEPVTGAREREVHV